RSLKMLFLLLSITAINAKVIDFSDTPLSCRSLQCPDGSSCMEMPEGAFCWPVFVKQTQVQASIDFPPAEITTTRPPKPSCASLQCSPDEQCVNAFDGPTCRRVTFSLSTKFITSTPPSSSPSLWSPEPIEIPSISFNLPSTRGFPPAPPSTFFHTIESKAIESGEMPPTFFRKPSVPNSCDRVRCPEGQNCYMREVKCFTVSCMPVPYCR
ncbi:hypothetical protein PENTCL1PPCAC_2168, partial [Pristionchus entomophagus]